MFSSPDSGEGITLFSTEYALQLVNILLLISPIGFILLLSLFRNIRRLEFFGGSKSFIIWLSIGGLLYIAGLYPQKLYAWDIFAWGSFGIVVLGASLFWQTYVHTKYFSYLTAILLTHSFLYFGAWLAMNNNCYASVTNYLDSFGPPDYGEQVGASLRLIYKQPIRDRDSRRKVLSVLEERLQAQEEYVTLISNYIALGDTANRFRVQKKYEDLFWKNEEKGLNSAADYALYLNCASPSQNRDPNLRKLFEPLFIRTVQLEPENPNHYIRYSDYLGTFEDYHNALLLLKEADLRIQAEKTASYKLAVTYPSIKQNLVILSYNCGNYQDAVEYFNEARTLGASVDDDGFHNALNAAILSYTYIGNLDKSRELVNFAKQNDIPILVDTENPPETQNNE